MGETAWSYAPSDRDCAVRAPAGAAGRPPLVDAARNADRDALRALLQKGANVNAAEADGTTALHWASYRDDVESADLLIRAGAKVNAANDLGATPLWTASQNGSAPMVRRLLAAGANPNAALLAGETPVMVAARSGNPAVVEQLIAKGANVNARGARGQTALMWAVSQKHPDVVKVLLAHGADVHARSDAWSQVMAVPPHGYLPYNQAIPPGGDTALLFAARVGDLASAKLLVAAGANVNDADAWGVSATTLAAHSGYRELVEFLLEKGADPNAAAAGFTALHEAIMRRDERMVGALLAHGADANAPLRTWTPTRRSSRRLQFRARARRRDTVLAGRALQRTGRHAPAGETRRRSAVRAPRRARGRGAGRQRVSTPDRGDDGADGRDRNGRRPTAWVQPDRGEREALTLEAVKLARRARRRRQCRQHRRPHGARCRQGLKYDTVVTFLVEHGAKPGIKTGQPAPRNADAVR